MRLQGKDKSEEVRSVSEVVGRFRGLVRGQGSGRNVGEVCGVKASV